MPITCIIYIIQAIISCEMSCFLCTCLALNMRTRPVSFTLLNNCVYFEPLVCTLNISKQGVISRSHTAFVSYLHLLVLGMTKETQQDVEKKVKY